MNCQEFESHLADALGNELEAETQAAFADHLRQCAKCREEYESAVKAVATMQALPGPARVNLRRESGRLIFEQAASRSDTGRWSMLRAMFGFRQGQAVRYAAAIFLAFTAGYLVRASVAPTAARNAGVVSMKGAVEDRSDNRRDVQQVLAGIYAQNPVRSDLAKALIAITSRTP